MRKEVKRKPIVGKQGKVIDLQSENPPLHVLERRILRMAVEARNLALNSLWYSHMNQVSDFQDLTEDGSTVDEDRKKKRLCVMETKKAEENRQQRLMKEWTTLPPEAKTDSVDWNAIYSEV
jgi:hypothetical protein